MSQGAASRNFRLGLDARTFQAGRRLPFNLASVFVQVKLPAGLVGRSSYPVKGFGVLTMRVLTAS